MSPNVRVSLLIFIFVLFGVVLVFRLFTLQVVSAGNLSELAREQYTASSYLSASRGSILASDGFPLAVGRESWLVWASLPDIEDPASVAYMLAPLLVQEKDRETDKQSLFRRNKGEEGVGGEESVGSTLQGKAREELVLEEEMRIKAQLVRDDVVWVALKHGVSSDVKGNVAALGISGIGFDLEEDRGHPEGVMAAHLLGFVGKDDAGEDKGYFGLEGYYDLTLAGAGGEKVFEKDAFGRPILLGLSREVNATPGITIQTHIDRSVQYIVERELEEGLELYGATSGTVVIMRPEDGAILAMAARPTYDPGRFADFGKEDYSNPAVSMSFEPGSIFKVLVMAASLDGGAVEPDDKCPVCAGPRRIDKYTLKTWDERYYPDTTPVEIIQHSDNVGMIWVAEELGSNRLYDYLSKFGIGQPTGIDLQGEANPVLRDKDEWGQVDLATASFGQGIAVTPIQMIRAVGALANGGRLVVPQVVDKLVGEGWEEDIEPVVGDAVVSQKTAEEVTQMMVSAVSEGEAKWTRIQGFEIAGKTGTAQIPVAGHYDSDKTIASFVGFAPADHPQFVMLVTLREPQSSPWASETAAPLWFSIAEELFPYFGIMPE